jgi:hypothetical protein
MYCPKCKTQYIEDAPRVCTVCSVKLVSAFPPVSESDYVKYLKLFAPRNAAELALIRGILDAEKINYYVLNDNFGSMYIGPQIELYNKKMIMVQDDQYEQAKDILTDFLDQTEDKDNAPLCKYSVRDKVRLVAEFLLFGWVMPGRRKTVKR